MLYLEIRQWQIKHINKSIETYNKIRLHMSLNFKTPNQVHLLKKN